MKINYHEKLGKWTSAASILYKLFFITIPLQRENKGLVIKNASRIRLSGDFG